MVSVSLSFDAERAVQFTSEALERHRLRAVCNFDLREALDAQDIPCPCPHHGTDACNCNYVVLSVYGMNDHGGQEPLLGQILIHTHNGDTWLSLPGDTSGQAIPSDDVNRRMLRALAEVIAMARP